jgi:hypothetical protein
MGLAALRLIASLVSTSLIRAEMYEPETGPKRQSTLTSCSQFRNGICFQMFGFFDRLYNAPPVVGLLLYAIYQDPAVISVCKILTGVSNRQYRVQCSTWIWYTAAFWMKLILLTLFLRNPNLKIHFRHTCTLCTEQNSVRHAIMLRLVVVCVRTTQRTQRPLPHIISKLSNPSPAAYVHLSPYTSPSMALILRFRIESVPKISTWFQFLDRLLSTLAAVAIED